MTFDQLIQWFDSVGVLGYLPGFLGASAVALGTFGFLKLFVRTRSTESDDWRDPPPILFKLFKCLAGKLEHCS